MPLIFITNNKAKIYDYLTQNFKKNFFIFEIEPKEKKYSIEDIRDVIKETAFFSEKIRIYLFYNFHLSSLEAQNAFLKILEEPPANTLFVLTTDNQYKILPTIISRSKVINLFEKNLNLEKDKELIIENFFKNKTIDLTIDEKITIDDLILFLRKNINKNKNIYLVLSEALKLRDLLEKNNLNKVLVLDHLLLKAKSIFYQ